MPYEDVGGSRGRGLRAMGAIGGDGGGYPGCISDLHCVFVLGAFFGLGLAFALALLWHSRHRGHVLMLMSGALVFRPTRAVARTVGRSRAGVRR